MVDQAYVADDKLAKLVVENVTGSHEQLFVLIWTALMNLCLSASDTIATLSSVCYNNLQTNPDEKFTLRHTLS